MVRASGAEERLAEPDGEVDAKGWLRRLERGGDVEGALVVVGGFSRCQSALGALGGPACVLDRVAPAAERRGDAGVAGELADGGIVGACLQGVGNRAVQPESPGGHEGVVAGTSEEGVGEREASELSRQRGNESGGFDTFEGFEALDQRGGGRACEQVCSELGTYDCGDIEEREVRCFEMCVSASEDPVDRAGKTRRRGRGQRADEQRIAVGLGMYGAAVAVAVQLPEKRRDFRCAETAKVDGLRDGQACEVTEEQRDRFGQIGRGVPRRQRDEDRRVRGATGKVANGGLGGGGRPVEVLDDEQHRAALRGAVDVADERVQEVIARRSGRGNGGLGQGGGDRRGYRCEETAPAGASADLAAGLRGELLVEDLREGLVGAVGLLEAGPEEHATSVGVHVDCELGEQSALPDACLAGDHRDEGVALTRTCPHVSEMRSFSLSSDVGRDVREELDLSRKRLAGGCCVARGVLVEQVRRSDREVTPVRRVELAKQRRNMTLDRSSRHVEALGDLGVAETLRQRGEDLALLRASRLVGRAETPVGARVAGLSRSLTPGPTTA